MFAETGKEANGENNRMKIAKNTDNFFIILSTPVLTKILLLNKGMPKKFDVWLPIICLVTVSH